VCDFFLTWDRSSWFAYAEPFCYMMKQQGPVVEFEYWDSHLLGLQLALCDSSKAVHIFFIGSLVWHCHEFRSFACSDCCVSVLVNENWGIFGAVHFSFISEA
jgi:hypothetical protein